MNEEIAYKEDKPELRVAGIQPEPKWEMRLVPDSNDVVFNLIDAPNVFFRFMQRICLGIQWTPK
jgi:hypothetical protein